eukprot:15180494-Alexandrium_andersonii.AAC.1
MSASLVGSEMCIRDSSKGDRFSPRTPPGPPPPSPPRRPSVEEDSSEGKRARASVSDGGALGDSA